jgi:hypothetical protein
MWDPGHSSAVPCPRCSKRIKTNFQNTSNTASISFDQTSRWTNDLFFSPRLERMFEVESLRRSVSTSASRSGQALRTGLCAYAITRNHVLDPAGPQGVRLVEHHGLALVVAEAELAPFAELDKAPAHVLSEHDPLVMLARRHDVVVRAVFERHPVLPLRFGTILRDDRAAARLLTDHHDEAADWLDRVAGHREWGVRARQARPDTSAETPTEGLSGTEYLAMRRGRLAAAARTRRDGSTAAAALHETLARHATESVPRTRKSGMPMLDAAYLVPAGVEAAFRAETERFPELAVEVTGPWPPYSFVRLELSTEEVAHA